MSARPRISSKLFPLGGETARQLEIVTPEKIPLRFELASAGDRAWAFLFDMVVITGITLAIALLATLATLGQFDRSWLGAITLLAIFLVRNFYFVWFELRRQGSTPGKKRLHIKVIDSNGGHLSGEAIFTRNLTRELEVFIPFLALIAPETLWPGATGVYYLFVIGWLVMFTLMPLFNRHRLRIGDMLAGTVVVLEPQAILLRDLSKSTTGAHTALQEARYEFTAEQLDIYGIYELQVLEDILRQIETVDLMTLKAVCEKIKQKISWPRDQWKVNSSRFLRDFYGAQRANLENKMLLGNRQEKKR